MSRSTEGIDVQCPVFNVCDCHNDDKNQMVSEFKRMFKDNSNEYCVKCDIKTK